jgi:hypothetical protein
MPGTPSKPTVLFGIRFASRNAASKAIARATGCTKERAWGLIVKYKDADFAFAQAQRDALQVRQHPPSLRRETPTPRQE